MVKINLWMFKYVSSLRDGLNVLKINAFNNEDLPHFEGPIMPICILMANESTRS